MRPLLACTLLALAACNDTDDTKDDAPTGSTDTDVRPFRLAWDVEREDDELGMMMSVWGTAPDDVSIVGGQKNGDGFVLRGTAGDFDTMTLPADTPMLNWVTGTGPDDVWVGGVAGTILRWNGSEWQDRSLAGVDGAIWGLAAMGTDDVLAVGGVFFAAGSPFLARWDGNEWTDVALPDDLAATSSLFKACLDDDAYIVVGASGASMWVDDDGATTITAPGFDDMVTCYTVPGERPIAVGGFSAGQLWELSGDRTTWAPLVDFTFSKLNGVHVLPHGTVVAVGDNGSTGTYAPEAGEWTEHDAAFTTELLHAVWVDENGGAYAVGGNFLTSGATFKGVVGHSPAP